MHFPVLQRTTDLDDWYLFGLCVVSSAAALSIELATPFAVPRVSVVASLVPRRIVRTTPVLVAILALSGLLFFDGYLRAHPAGPG